MSRHLSRCTAYFFWIILGSMVAARQCYYPDGTEANDVPCSDANNTHCCYETSICLSNGYCLNTYPNAYVVARSSCTDTEWGPSCPQDCNDPDYDEVSGASPIILWGRIDEVPYYCCGELDTYTDDVGCAYGRDPFTLDSADLMFGHAALENATLVAGSNSASGATTDSSSAPTTTVTATSSDNSCEGEGEGEGEEIGLGLGVPLGVTTLLALGWGLWERRKRVNSQPPAGGDWNMQSMPEPAHSADDKPHGLGRIVTATMRSVTWRTDK